MYDFILIAKNLILSVRFKNLYFLPKTALSICSHQMKETRVSDLNPLITN